MKKTAEKIVGVINGFFDSYDRWSPIVAKLVVVCFLTYASYHCGVFNGRKMESQEMAHANTMYNEMVACVKIREMVKHGLRRGATK